MTTDEAINAVRLAKAGWQIPSLVASEAVAAVCEIVFDKANSPRDRLRAVETLLAIERLNIDLAAAGKGQSSEENRVNHTFKIVKLTSDEWRQCRESGITAQQLLGTEPPRAHVSAQRNCKAGRLENDVRQHDAANVFATN